MELVEDPKIQGLAGASALRGLPPAPPLHRGSGSPRKKGRILKETYNLKIKPEIVHNEHSTQPNKLAKLRQYNFCFRIALYLTRVLKSSQRENLVFYALPCQGPHLTWEKQQMGWGTRLCLAWQLEMVKVTAGIRMHY